MRDNHADLSGENSPHWQGGISFEPYCQKFNESFKESIREKFGNTCFLCGKSQSDNRRKLSVHHVNYDKNCLCDDSHCEFVPLCMMCHAKTNHNREHYETLISAMLESKRDVIDNITEDEAGQGFDLLNMIKGGK